MSDDVSKSMDNEKGCDKCTANRTLLKCTGPYIIGPLVAYSPVKCLKYFIGRKMATSRYYILKLLTLKNEDGDENIKVGKNIIFNEYFILSLLGEENGIPIVRGFYEEDVLLPLNNEQFLNNSKMSLNFENKNEKCRRLCLVLDCYMNHEYSISSKEYVMLQDYVLSKGTLPESEALTIFLQILRIVNYMHQKNVVHRDLKLGNIVLNLCTKKIIIINFGLGKHLMHSDDILHDRKGSPAYMSPEILSGQPYHGKPADLWSLGVSLFIMLFGRFPFYDTSPEILFTKILRGKYKIPKYIKVVDTTKYLLQHLLLVNPQGRLNTNDCLLKLNSLLSKSICSYAMKYELQIVPDLEEKCSISKTRRISNTKMPSRSSWNNVFQSPKINQRIAYVQPQFIRPESASSPMC